MSAFGQTKPSMWSRIQFTLSGSGGGRRRGRTAGVAGSTETTSPLGQPVAVVDDRAGDDRVALAARWLAPDCAASRPRFANAGTTSASAETASAAASSYAAANSVDVESSPAMRGVRVELADERVVLDRGDLVGGRERVGGGGVAGASMTSLMAPPESGVCSGGCPRTGGRDRRNQSVD